MSKFNEYVDADANYNTVKHYFNPDGNGAMLKCQHINKDGKNLLLNFWWATNNINNLYFNTREVLSKYLSRAIKHYMNDILKLAIQYAYDDKCKTLLESKMEAQEILKYLEEQENKLNGIEN